MTQNATQATGYQSNNERHIVTAVAEFLMSQRNVGFADNDGRWIVSQLPELYWSPIGALRRRRPGAFLGAFDTEAAALTAIENAAPQPENDGMVR